MIVITVAAVFLGASTTVLGTGIAFLMGWIVWYVAPAALLSIAVFTRGDMQAFAMGALIPWIGPLARWPVDGRSFGEVFGMTFALLMTGGVCGIVAAVTRRWIVDRNPD
jgi:hypothetical protein